MVSAYNDGRFKLNNFSFYYKQTVEQLTGGILGCSSRVYPIGSASTNVC